MSVPSVDAIERTVHKANRWLSELTEEGTEDREEAWRILKSYLQLLRDQLTIDEGAGTRRSSPSDVRSTRVSIPATGPTKVCDGEALGPLGDARPAERQRSGRRRRRSSDPRSAPPRHRGRAVGRFRAAAARRHRGPATRLRGPLPGADLPGHRCYPRRIRLGASSNIVVPALVALLIAVSAFAARINAGGKQWQLEPSNGSATTRASGS
jgi:hypothetical protein